MNAPILVLGGTGSFGRAAVREMLGLGQPTRCLVRDLSKASALLGEDGNLELIQGDV